MKRRKNSNNRSKNKKVSRAVKKYWWVGLVLIIGVIAVFAFGLMQSVLFPDSTGYIVDSFNDGKITYSGVITQTQGGGFLRTNQVWTQWVGGTGANWIFYNHLGWLKYYVENGLGINSNDFTILAGDGDQVKYGCHLRPNYCKQPYGDYEYVGFDSDGCPRYNIFTVSQRCWCYQDYKICEPQSNPCIGAAQCGWGDCSTRTLSISQYGGSSFGVKNYKTILEADGWNYDWQENCWMKSEASITTADKIAVGKSCKAFGTFVDGLSYSYFGKMKWEGINDGYSCQLTDTFESKKIADGKVEFTPEVSVSFYHFENNICIVKDILPSQKTENDYLSLSECQSKIITSAQNQTTNISNNQTQPSGDNTQPKKMNFWDNFLKFINWIVESFKNLFKSK